MGMKLDEATVDLCGRAEKVIATRDSTTIIGGKGNDIESRVQSLQDEIANTTSDYSKQMLEERLAQLTGGIGVIRVGAYTDTEFNSKKYKFENAINATQAALQEGIVAGGGIALAVVSHKLEEHMFRKALIAPFNQMTKNAGYEEATKTDDSSSGIDFKSKNIVDMFDAGIIDPFKVTRLALESATAIAISLVSTEVVIVEEEDVKTKTG